MLGVTKILGGTRRGYYMKGLLGGIYERVTRMGGGSMVERQSCRKTVMITSIA